MAVSQINQVLIGTDETTGDTITNNGTDTGVEVDLLGGTIALGYANIYLKFTSTVTAGSLDITLIHRPVTGQPYSDVPNPLDLKRSYAPINGTQKILCWRMVPISRYMSVTILNNATGANATNVLVRAEVFKIT